MKDRATISDFSFPPFQPHPWFRNSHAQTILPIYLRRRRPLPAVRHRIQLDDGDSLVLHDNCPATWRAGDRVALLIHGLGGSHNSPYMPRIAGKLNTQGVRTFRMDLRGHGMGWHLAQHPGHAGRSEDATAAVSHIAELCPDSPVTVVGVSMGGNIVLKMLGEAGDIPPGNVANAIVVAPPIDIATCSRHMLRPQNRLYTRAFARGLIRQVKRRRRFIQAMHALPLRPYPRTLWEFDDRFTAPLGGFTDASHYYEQCSAAPLLSQITVPTLIIAATDDPIIPVQIFHQAVVSDTTRMVITEHGGHAGFFAAPGIDRDRNWLDWRIVDWTLAPSKELHPVVRRSDPAVSPAASRVHHSALTR